MRKLFVGNLNFQSTESDLAALFEPFGEISDIKVITDLNSGRSRGFAFIEMTSEEAANKAMNELNGKEMDGRALNVSEAKPKEDKDKGNGGRFGNSNKRYGKSEW